MTVVAGLSSDKWSRTHGYPFHSRGIVMRMTRPLAIAMATVVALPAISSAQHGRQFKNSWFWGRKGRRIRLG